MLTSFHYFLFFIKFMKKQGRSKKKLENFFLIFLQFSIFRVGRDTRNREKNRVALIGPRIAYKVTRNLGKLTWMVFCSDMSGKILLAVLAKLSRTSLLIWSLGFIFLCFYGYLNLTASKSSQGNLCTYPNPCIRVITRRSG